MFHIGQRVVCVDDSITNGCVADHVRKLQRNTLYHVRDVLDWNGKKGVRLEEIVLPHSFYYGSEHGYLASRFRPVKETDISIFRQMLVTPPKEKVGV